MGKTLSLLWLTDLRGWCEALKPRWIVMRQHLMFNSGKQNHAYLNRHHIYACVWNFILPMVFQLQAVREVFQSSKLQNRIFQRWSPWGRPQGHDLKSLVLASKLKPLALKPASPRKCPILGSRTALVFDLLKMGQNHEFFFRLEHARDLAENVWKPFFLFFLENAWILRKNLFVLSEDFFSENSCALCPWSLASRGSVLGRSFLGLDLGFFWNLALALSLVSSTPPPVFTFYHEWWSAIGSIDSFYRKDYIEKLDFEDIIADFASAKALKVQFWGGYWSFSCLKHLFTILYFIAWTWHYFKICCILLRAAFSTKARGGNVCSYATGSIKSYIGIIETIKTLPSTFLHFPIN